MQKLVFFDSTLRDGSHAVQNQLPVDGISNYCSLANDSGFHTVIVGPGNGLGSSSLQVNLSKHDDNEMLQAAHNALTIPKLGIYMIPGFATIKDNMQPALESGVEVFCVGCHCTEADTTRQHIEFARNQEKEAYGVLMMYHLISKEELLVQAQLMQEYGAQGVIIMDSAGASCPTLVKQTISTLYDGLNVPVGFHAHNNLGMAVGNTWIAIQEGASIIDSTIKGFGAGAGNCQTEALVALLERENIRTGLNLYNLLDLSDFVSKKFCKETKGLDSTGIVSGMSGVFSAFATQIDKASKEFGVDGRDIFTELGKLKAVGGQEDLIIEVALKLQQKKKSQLKESLLESLA